MRFLYILAEVLFLYVLLMSISVGTVWLWRGFDPLGQLLILGCSVIYFFASVRLVLIGDRHSLWTGSIVRCAF